MNCVCGIDCDATYRSLLCADEELGAVGVRTRVGHGQNTCKICHMMTHQSVSRVTQLTWARVPQSEVLVTEGLPEDGDGAGAVPLAEVPALGHEPGDDAVEGGACEHFAKFRCHLY